MDNTQLLQQILDGVTRIEAKQASDHAALARIEGKQDFLVKALTEEDPPSHELPLEPSDPK